jgi:hypothetical protein
MSRSVSTWEFASPIKITRVTIPNATLRTTDRTILVPAQGPNTLIVPIFITAFFNYGSSVWTGGGSVRTEYGTTLTSGLLPVLLYTNTNSSQVSYLAPAPTSLTLSNRLNQDLNFYLTAGLIGNATNDNTFSFEVIYYVIQL